MLEKSTVDVREGWMETESRNLEWTGVLSVVEKGRYTRAGRGDASALGGNRPLDMSKDEGTDVTTTVTFHSRFGQARLLSHRRKPDTQPNNLDGNEEKKGFFASWSTASLQRTIEAMGVRRTRDALVKSKDGMNVVLERLRMGGLVGVLEGMRRDREMILGGVDGWKWRGTWVDGKKGDEE